MSDPANRARVERLLKGERRNDDLTRLFLYLRDRCDGRESVQEIGDFVAHHEERKKGLITRSTQDWHVCAHYVADHLEGTLNFNALPSYYPRFLGASLRRIPPSELKKNTGLSLREAAHLLPRAIARLVHNADGTYSTSKEAPPSDEHLMWALSQTLVVKPAFDAGRLSDDFKNSLKSNGLLLKGEMRAFEELNPYVTAFAVSVMHDCSIQIAEGKSIRLNAVADYRGKLQVEAEIAVPVTDPRKPYVLRREDNSGAPEEWRLPVENGAVLFSAGIFDTMLDMREHCEEALLSEPSPWKFPIEVSATGKLVRLS